MYDHLMLLAHELQTITVIRVNPHDVVSPIGISSITLYKLQRKQFCCMKLYEAKIGRIFAGTLFPKMN